MPRNPGRRGQPNGAQHCQGVPVKDGHCSRHLDELRAPGATEARELDPCWESSLAHAQRRLHPQWAFLGSPQLYQPGMVDSSRRGNHRGLRSMGTSWVSLSLVLAGAAPRAGEDTREHIGDHSVQPWAQAKLSPALGQWDQNMASSQ